MSDHADTIRPFLDDCVRPNEALDALLAERQQTQEDYRRLLHDFKKAEEWAEAVMAARDELARERQQAIDALREIASLSMCQAATAAARVALLKLGEQP